MKRNVVITIHPANADSDQLTVRDAMEHVLDMLALLRLAEEPGEPQEELVWRLSSASTNSPFAVEIEASAKKPALAIDRRAAKTAKRCGAALSAFVSGDTTTVPSWVRAETLDVAQRLALRNMNGIGRTDINLGAKSAPIVIGHREARAAVETIERVRREANADREDFAHSAIGSIEGQIVSAATYNNMPAIRVLERVSGQEVVCVIPQEIEDRIGRDHSLAEVWRGQHVLIEGTIRYKEDGEIRLVTASDLQRSGAHDVTLQQVRDARFTGGLSPAEYLDRLRDGTLG